MENKKSVKSPFQVKKDTRVITKKLTHDGLVSELTEHFFEILKVEFDATGTIKDLKGATYVYGSAVMATLVECGFDTDTAYGVAKGINKKVQDKIEIIEKM